MIENVDLVFQRNPCGYEAGNRCDDVARGHITRGIVIEADDQYTGVGSVRCLDHFVQVQEIVVISRYQDERVLHRIDKMPCIRCPRKMHTRRYSDHMTGMSQKRHQAPIGRVII